VVRVGVKGGLSPPKAHSILLCVVWTQLNASTLTHGPIGPIARLTGACCRVGAV